MAKEKNGKKGWWIIGICGLTLTLIGMIVAGTLAFNDTDNKTETNYQAIIDHKAGTTNGFKDMAENHKEELGSLKEDGCDPGRQAITAVAVINTKLDMMSAKQETMRIENKENQEAMRIENKESFEKILLKLEK